MLFQSGLTKVVFYDTLGAGLQEQGDSMNENIQLRDTRMAYFCWQQIDAMRILYEKHDGAESQKLVSLYVALTMKSFREYGADFNTTSQDIIDYTHLSKDWVPSGLRMLQEDGLISMDDVRNKEGKFSGKRISLLTVGGAAAGPRPDDGFLGVGLPYIYNNVESEDSTIIKKKRTESKDSVSEVEPRKSKVYHIDRLVWESVKDIFLYASEKKLFTSRLPEDDGSDAPLATTKTIFEAVRDIYRIQEGTFLATYSLESKKLQPNNYREQIYHALDEFDKMKNDISIWPADKSVLPKSMRDWFINPRTGYSFFIKCLDEGAVPTRETMMEKSISEDYEDQYLDLFLDWWKDYKMVLNDMQVVSLKVKISNLIREHALIWKEYGQYYAEIDNWAVHFGGENPRMFLKKYAQYLREKGGEPALGKVAPVSYSFDNFKTWIRNEYKFNLCMNENEYDDLKSKVERKKQPIKARPATEAEIADMLDMTKGVRGKETL